MNLVTNGVGGLKYISPFPSRVAIEILGLFGTVPCTIGSSASPAPAYAVPSDHCGNIQHPSTFQSVSRNWVPLPQ